MLDWTASKHFVCAYALEKLVNRDDELPAYHHCYCTQVKKKKRTANNTEAENDVSCCLQGHRTSACRLL